MYRIWIDFYEDVQKARKKTLYISKSNSPWDITLHLLEWLSSTNNKCWGGCGEKESLLLLVGMYIVVVIIENIWRLLLKLKIELHIIQQLLEENEDTIIIRKDTCTPMSIATEICCNIQQRYESNLMPFNRWPAKEYVANISNGIFLLDIHSLNEWNLAICNNNGWTQRYYAMWNKSKTERQILYDFT